MAEIPEQVRDKLQIPRSEDDAATVPGFATAAAFAMGVMARIDGIVTAEEYIAMSHAAEALAELSDNPVLIRVNILRGATDSTSLEDALEALAAAAEGKAPKLRGVVFQALVPLLACQRKDIADYCGRWADALDINDTVRAQVLELLPTEQSEAGFFSSLFNAVMPWSSPDTRLEQATRIAKTFQDEELLEFLKATKDEGLTPESSVTLTQLVSAAKNRALERAQTVLPNDSVLDNNISLTLKYSRLADAFIEQIELRLLAVTQRMTLDETMFNEDLEAFITNVTTKVELEMRNLVAGDKKDWTDEQLWQEFADNTLPDLIKEKYEPLQKRYQRIMEQWNADLAGFSKEMKSTAASVLDTIPDKVFAKLLDTSVKSEKYMALLDQSAEAVSDMVTWGTSILIATGSLGAVAAVVAGSPVIAAVGAGTVGGLLIYKHFVSDTEIRKQESVREKSKVFRERLIELLGDPGKQFSSELDQIRALFAEKANEIYGPLVRDLRLVGMQANLQKQLVKQVFTDTRNSFVLKAE